MVLGVVPNMYVNILQRLTSVNIFSLKLTGKVDWYQNLYLCTIMFFLLIEVLKINNSRKMIIRHREGAYVSWI